MRRVQTNNNLEHYVALIKIMPLHFILNKYKRGGCHFCLVVCMAFTQNARLLKSDRRYKSFMIKQTVKGQELELFGQ